MSAVTDDGADLERGLTALSQRFGRVSVQLAEAGQALIDHHSLPEEALLQEVVVVREQFESLRARTLEVAASLSVQLAEPIGGLAELDAAVRGVLAESAGRARRAADEQSAARREAEDEARRTAEEGARRKAEDEARRRAAEEARRKADEEAAAARRRTEEEAKRQAEAAVEQKAEAEARRKADEEARRKAGDETRRKAEEDARRKAETEARRKAEEEAKRKAAEEAKRAADEEAAARRKADEEAKRKAEAEAKRKAEGETRQKAEAEAGRKAAEDARRKADEEAAAKRKAAEEAKHRAEAEARRKAEEDARRKPEEGAKPKAPEEVKGKTDDEDAKRKAGEDTKRKVEEARRKLEEVKRRLETAPAAAAGSAGRAGLETAQWWISASAAWGNLKSRQVHFADAVRDALGKYAYVFSVPVQTSADYEDGLLAYGFAVLLEHVDQHVAGFVGEALNRLPTRPGATFGRRLYEYLATPLKTRYPDFVKAVMEAGLPKPGLWVNGGIDESEAETVVLQPASMQVGDPNQRAERITQDRLRLADHHFSVAIAPLTARFVRVQAAALKEPREVEIRMAEKGVPSDQGWIAVLGPRDMTPQVRRHDRQGSRVSGLGRDCASVWVGLFNADPETDRRVELALTLRRKGQTAAQSAFRRR
ncbi:MAG: hypothetical protein ACREM3_26970 [Candidatus Rokuibacteriota bacterium]